MRGVGSALGAEAARLRVDPLPVPFPCVPALADFDALSAVFFACPPEVDFRLLLVVTDAPS
jgi:hypothetical protein